ncbi:uncharacterized protein LOC5572382 [Aedes aegypti]|uniref:Uncharacterized protein n=1 Tax=Aedes aegypti TaxID=7159 RepID=A0A6I8U9Z6_AEDAE|nr:uncharacterized protein LOC110674715 [Aedes aegypti]XP_021694465.1 uncharacterized protein LOC110674715 [Aedes aegypti]XP_021712867.1 uncharacterized protein LOC5572382 [Aedes aegypti]XP_021712868.1 uncharacterized protein LOC5572382 [Aedes aegypti]
MEDFDASALKQKILSITSKTPDGGYKCEASQNCSFTSVNRLVVRNFARHLKSFHSAVYTALLMTKTSESSRSTRHRIQSAKSKKTIKSKILTIVKKTELDYICNLGMGCTYKQPLLRLNPGNFARHLCKFHPEDYKRLDLGKIDADNKPTAKFRKTLDMAGVQVLARVNRYQFLCGLIRLVTMHGLPFDCLLWSGMQDIIGPLLDALKMTMDTDRIKEFVDKTAKEMREMICESIRGRLVALQLHGTMVKGGQYLVKVSCSYMNDSYICKQMLGVFTLDDTSTCMDFEDKFNKIKERCDLEQWQIYTISIDYGRVTLNQDEMEEQRNDADDSKFIEILGQYNATLTDVNVLQCGRHLLSMVATEATQECADVVEEVIEMVKSFRHDEHKAYFQSWHGRYPTTPDKNNYGFGTYLMMKALRDDRSFYEQFTLNYPGFALYMHWDFIDEFVAAFEPLYECAEKIGDCGLSDFHLQWLLAYGRIGCLEINRFRDCILRAMQTRQQQLQELAPYRAALYMDPRLNFRGSKLFDHSKKEKIITFLQSIYTMMEDSSGDDQQDCPTPSSSTSMQSPGDFSMNAFLTEMLGEGSPESAMEDLIREIQHQERCDADDQDFDIIKYWAQKKMHDTRLWTLARVVFAPLATQCEVDDDLGEAMAGSEGYVSFPKSPAEDDSLLQEEGQAANGSGEDAAWSAVFVKKNSNLLAKAVLQVICNDKSYEMSCDV